MSTEIDEKALEIAAKRMCMFWVGVEDLDNDPSRHAEIAHAWFLGRARYVAFTKRVVTAYLSSTPSAANAREKKLEEALRRINQTLCIPAAEYVPAIRDVFDIIDTVLANVESK